MNASLLDNRHGTEILLFAALVGEAGIPPGHLYVAMTQKQLQTFQAHAGIEQFACKGMPKTVQSLVYD